MLSSYREAASRASIEGADHAYSEFHWTHHLWKLSTHTSTDFEDSTNPAMSATQDALTPTAVGGM